ncbi:GAP family protein [Actinospica robiniae]|uniref:GAP family protein n=1 Tax=Actinospica robiniae TaxID=304901 RepID=UPI0004011570|nr:GAP family protein [Actinospica robiniae]
MLWEAVLAALIAGFAPWTLLIVATLLSRERPMHHALIFLATAAAITLLVGFLVVEALGNTDLENRHQHHSVSPAIDLGLGIAVLVFVPYFARRSPKPKPDPKDRPARTSRFHRKSTDSRAWWERKTGLLAVIALGAFVGSPSPLYLASLHSVTKGRPGGAVGALEVLLLAVVVLLMAEVPIILFALAPDRTAALLHSANAWLAVHGRTIVIVALTGAGVYFTINGLARLIG